MILGGLSTKLIGMESVRVISTGTSLMQLALNMKQEKSQEITMKIRIVSLCVIISIWNVVSLAEDWPQWRGINQDGISSETGLLSSWPEGGPKLAWKATGLGDGYASVAVVDSCVYTAGEKDGVSYVHAVEIGRDKPKWSTPIGKAGAPGWGGFTGPRSTPTIAQGKIYVIGQYGELVCLNVTDGKLIWQKHLEKDLGGKIPTWGFSESVLVDGNKVLCTPGGEQGTLAALNAATGEVLWRSTACQDETHYSSIVKAEICGVSQYVQLTAAHVIGVGLDGNVLWQAERTGRNAVIPTPIVTKDMVYVASGYNVGSNLFVITKDGGQFTATEKYAEKTMNNQHGGVVLVGEYLYGYCDSKGWTCQSLMTGEAMWTEKKQVGKGSLTVADNMLYLRSEDGGVMALVTANPKAYQEKSRFTLPDTGEQAWAHPVISSKTLYVRYNDNLYAYDIAAQ